MVGRLDYWSDGVLRKPYVRACFAARKHKNKNRGCQKVSLREARAWVFEKKAVASQKKNIYHRRNHQQQS